MDQILIGLMIMGKGMLGIFAVACVIIICIMVLNRISRNSKMEYFDKK